MSKSKVLVLLLVVIVMGLLAACASATPETITIIETVEVEKEIEVEVEKIVEVEVEKEVIKEVEVEKIVEVEVEKEGAIEEVKLVARCKGTPPFENGRCDNLTKAVGAANAELAATGDNRRISLEAIQDDAQWGDYKTEFELASDAGEAPDIIVSGHEHIGDWATAGFLTDITAEIDKYPEFADVIDSLWNSAELGGSIWGIPQDAEARPFFYSKPLLRDLGWTDEEIESLDERVAAGEFTWQDMLDTAAEAVEKGVVEPGEGWWHRPSNGPDFLYYYYGAGGEIMEAGSDALVFDTVAAQKVYAMLEDASQNRNIIRKDVLSGDWDFFKEYTSKFNHVMFVTSGTWRWANWVVTYNQDVGGEDYMFENVGYAPIPGNEEGTGEPITLTHPLVYMISSQSEAPDLALLLLSKATTKELNTDYAVASGHLGVLKSQADYGPYKNAKFLSATLPLLEYTTFLPNSPFWSSYSEAYYLGIQAVESGDLTADEAIEVVVDQLQNELGDNVIIK